MSIKSYLKRYKPLHWIHNLLHLDRVSHNRPAYRQYGFRRSVLGSVSSRDFPDKTSRAWLDTGDSMTLAGTGEGFNDFTPEIREALRHWSANGYLIARNAISGETADAINAEVTRLVKEEQLQFTHDNKLPFLNKRSGIIDKVTRDPELIRLLSFILGKEVVPFQTLNFIRGSGQKAHSDSIHMTTYPLGYLIAVWIALEDIDEKSGPLFYFPGSHQLPYLLNDDFGNISNAWMLGNKEYADYEEVIEDLISKKNMQKQVFLPKKGDALVWHANLLHGGMPVLDPSLTRKSLVIHYFAKDVIKYHEITERPAVL